MLIPGHWKAGLQYLQTCFDSLQVLTARGIINTGYILDRRYNMAGLTPMMQQYMQIKEQHKDAILFFRLGDFYEMFFEDAILASRELEITLTGRECGLEDKAPMCGVPYHAADGYIARLIEKGHKVAICEQTQDPEEANGLVERQVIRVINRCLAHPHTQPSQVSGHTLATLSSSH